MGGADDYENCFAAGELFFNFAHPIFVAVDQELFVHVGISAHGLND
jgi:hypothetical protein